MGVFDVFVGSAFSLRFPRVYQEGIQGELFNARGFAVWIFQVRRR